MEVINVADVDNATLQQRLSQREYNYLLTPNMYIEANLNYIMTQDKRIWGKNSEEFNINHWIKHESSENNENNDDDDLLFVKNIHSTPFLLGKRYCPGERLAMKEFYGIIANIILNYRIEPCKDKNGKYKPIVIKSIGDFAKSVVPDIPVMLYPIL